MKVPRAARITPGQVALGVGLGTLAALVLEGCATGNGQGPSGGEFSDSGGAGSSSGGAELVGGSPAGGRFTDGAGGAGGSGRPNGGSLGGGGAATGGDLGFGGRVSGGGSPSAGSTGDGGSGGGPGSGGALGAGGGEGCGLGVWDGQPKTPLELSGNTFAHDPTLIRVGDTYYRFWTGDFIPSATSRDLRTWTNGPNVYPNVYPSWATQWLAEIPGETFNFPWAPDVSSFGDKVHIYSSFSAKFGDNISCITHLSTDNIGSAPWTDHGPVICTQGTENMNAIDADVGFDVDGNPFLSFGSFWDGIFIFELNPDGSRKGDELTRLAWASQIEAPVLFERCGYYYLFVTWGLCCPGEGRSVNDLTYRVVVGRSESIRGPYVDKAGKAMTDGGGTLIVQGDKTTWAAAGHSDVFVDGSKIYHTYHAYRQSSGSAVLRIVELPFDEDGWPVGHAP